MRGLVVWVAVAVAWAGQAQGEFWPTPYFLQQPPEAQRHYMTGLIDMYEHTRKVIAPDPADPVMVCVLRMTGESIRSRFIDWVLDEPALWRLSPAELFLQAMKDICAR